MNLLIVSMPDVGKSTLLNALQSSGIARRLGPYMCPTLMSTPATAKALRTSAQLGLMYMLLTLYAFDSCFKLFVDLPVYGDAALCGPRQQGHQAQH